MVQLHHIVSGNGKRRQHESVESVIALCYIHHHGTFGVHGREGRELNITLKRKLQNKYKNQGYEKEEIREMMGGRLY